MVDRPAAKLTGLAYPDSTDCTGRAAVFSAGTANVHGAFEVTLPVHLSSHISVRYAELAGDGSVIETTNCVVLVHQLTDVRLAVNGSTGPVLVDGGEIHMVATGLAPGSVAHAVLGCSGPFEPDDFGQVIGPDGVFEAYLSDDLPNEFAIRVALAPPAEVSSNCVWVRLVSYLIDPVIAVNGSQAPPAVERDRFRSRWKPRAGPRTAWRSR